MKSRVLNWGRGIAVPFLLAAALPGSPARGDSTVVFNEVMYHPAGEPTHEWVELYNQMAVDMDLSGWRLAGAVSFQFPEKTVLKGGAYLVVAAVPEALAAQGASGALGPFSGRLDDGGEDLLLLDVNNRTLDEVDYNDGGRWPVGPDGSGASLAKLSPGLSSDAAANWGASWESGGTPGKENFPASGTRPPLPADLVSFWSFDEASGRALDQVSTNHGTLGSTAFRVPGPVGKGLTFDNTNSAFVNVGSGAGNNFSVTGGVTIEAMIQPLWSAAAGDTDSIFRKDDGPNRVLLAFQNDGNQDGLSEPAVPPGPVLAFGLNAGGVYKELDMPLDGQEGRPSQAALLDGKPHHLAAAYDSATGLKAIYIDGAPAFSHTLAAGSQIASGGTGTAYLGNTNGRADPFSGLLDEIAYWRRALTAAEVKAHRDRAAAGQAYFGAVQLTSRPPIAFNEVLAGAEGWLELVNHGTEPLDLTGYSISRAGGGIHLIPAMTLPPGERLVRTRQDLGFAFLPGDRLFLYLGSGAVFLDGVKLTATHLARLPEGTGPWLAPGEATPGAQNRVTLQTDVVINEIMYHPRPLQAHDAVVEDTELLPLEADWRYDQSGVLPGADWHRPEFDDAGWASGPALLYNENAALPAPKRTLLSLGPTTYYFRTRFELSALPAGELVIRAIVDDGAVFYLNGVEVGRINMAPGTVLPSTLASPGVGDADFSPPISVEASKARVGTNVLAVEVHQGAGSSTDVVFGASLAARLILEPAAPFRDSPGAWIELYNKSDAPVDLTGWKLAGGIQYSFAPGAGLPARSYLLVAQDRDYLAARYPGVAIAGEYQGRLSFGGERITLLDQRGNPADEVHYFDGGWWPEYADGGGSSLELRDPRADNSKAEAWRASDETAATEWRDYSYRAAATQAVGPVFWNEVVLGLLDTGEALVDDFEVFEDPAGARRQLVRNPDFESGTDRWRLLGNHGRSVVIADPADPSNHVLHLIASGATEHMHNHLESTLITPIINGRLYEVRFRARWLAGSNQLNTRLYFNRAPKTTLLEVPERGGTPGALNSRAAANLGPTYSRFGHAPVAPQASDEVAVSVEASDPDGVASVDLWYSVNAGAWASVPMTAAGPNGLYRASVPGQAASALVQFYVEGRDALGNTSTFPPKGRDSRALYKVNDGQAVLGKVHNFRILMTAADVNFLHLVTNVMSNERLLATVVYDEREAFYDAGVRLKGSERGRPEPGRVGFNVEFQPEHLFRGVHRSVHADRSGGWALGGPNGQDEILIKHMINKAGGIPGMYDDIIRVIAPRPAQTGSALLMMARYEDVYLDSQYLDGSDGTAYKIELIYYPTTTTGGSEGLKRPQPDDVIGSDLRDMGDDKEAYRWTFLIENNRDRDDYSPLIELGKAFGAPAASLEARSREVMDVSEWMRAFAAISLTGVNDIYTQGNNHNFIFYQRPEDGMMLALPWDMDFSFTRSTNAPLWGDQNLSRIISLSANRRVYLGHLQDLMKKSFNTEYMTYWTGHYAGLAGQNWSSLLGYIGQRAAFVRTGLPPALRFQIVTNGGQDLVTDQASLTIEGDAWIDVADIVLTDVIEPLELTWPTLTRWRTTVPLRGGANDLRFFAFDRDGKTIGSDAMVVTSTIEPVFIRGDANLDSALDIADPLAVLFHLFAAAPLGCLDAADADDDEALGVTDVIRVLDHLFRAGPAPAAPHPAAGVDSTGAGELDCKVGI